MNIQQFIDMIKAPRTESACDINVPFTELVVERMDYGTTCVYRAHLNDKSASGKTRQEAIDKLLTKMS